MSVQPFSYCFLRYVHSPESGEFANVGALLWAPESQFLGFEASPRYARLSAFFHDFDADGYRSMIQMIGHRFDDLGESLNDPQPVLLREGEPPLSARDLASRVVPIDDACLQWSLSGGGETTDPAGELASLYRDYIEIHNESVKREGRDATAVFNDVYRRAFESPEVVGRIREHEVVAPLDQHVFHQAWKNGVWNVYETLSFDLIEAEAIRNKAHRWDSRARHLLEAKERPHIHFLLGQPQGDRNAAAYGRAKDILHSSEATLIEEDEARDFAGKLANAVANAEVA